MTAGASAASERCIGEPISWLRLEQLALGEGQGGDAAAQQRAHLAQCAACAAAYARIVEDERGLPALPAIPALATVGRAERPVRGRAALAEQRLPWWRRWQLATGGLAAAMALAVVVVMVRKPDMGSGSGSETGTGSGSGSGSETGTGSGSGSGSETGSGSGSETGSGSGSGSETETGSVQAVRIKGAGAIVVTLVRERAGAISFDPADVLPDDRWKIQLTCAPGGAAWADVAIYQRGEASFPLAPQPLDCGNAVVLPGAFRITDGGAELCVVLSEAAIDRATLAASPSTAAAPRALEEAARDAVCTVLTAPPGPPAPPGP